MANAWELGAAILGGLGALVGIRAGTEQPRYTVVERLGAIEICLLYTSDAADE